MFGKAATAITSRLLESNEPFDVKPFLTKNHKASVEDIQAAVNGEICAEQAEKLRIIRSHMSSLELCKLNLESLILSTAEKYIPRLNLVLTVPGIKSFSAIGVISVIGVDMSVFPASKHLCSWAGSYAAEQRECREEENNSHQQSRGLHQAAFSVMCACCRQKQESFGSRQPIPCVKEAERTQKGYCCYCQNAVDRHLQHSGKK